VLNAKVLWIGFSGKSDHSHSAVLKRLRRGGLIEFCAAVIRDGSSFENEVLDEPLISHYDAKFARYERAVANFSGIVDQESYASFAPFEGETLRMMDHLVDPYTNCIFHVSYEERRQMFLRHCSFWSGYLSKRGVTHCVFFTVPHEVYDFVILNIAQLLDIPTIILHREKTLNAESEVTLSRRSPYTGYFYPEFFVSENLADIGSWNLAKEIKETGSLMGINFVCSSHLSDLMSGNNKSAEKLMVSSRQFNFALARKVLIARLKKPMTFLLVLGRIIRVFNERRSHSIFSEKERSNQNFVLYCLPYQPEESSSPRGGIFTEQLLVLKMLSESLPVGWSIRVREHPDQYWRLQPRATGFWSEVARIPKVSVAPLSEPLCDSYRNARAVALVAGSSAVEAWIQGIPVLLFGKMFLRFAPRVFQIETINDLKVAFLNIERGIVIKNSEIDKFISWSELYTFVGCLGKLPKVKNFPFSTVATTTDNLESILICWFKLRNSKFE